MHTLHRSYAAVNIWIEYYSELAARGPQKAYFEMHFVKL